jgi:hypothetical protein
MTLLGLAGLWSRLGSWIADAFGAVASFAVRYPWQAMVVALLIIAGVLGWRVDGLTREVKARDATIAGIKAAQKVATDDQIHINQLPAITSAAIARQSDAQAPAYYASVGSAVAAHDSVVRGACAAGPVGNAGVPGPDPVAPIHDGPVGVAIVVSRPKVDDDLIVAAAGRAAKMHQDALDLIAKGDAVADDAPTTAPD